MSSTILTPLFLLFLLGYYENLNDPTTFSFVAWECCKFYLVKSRHWKDTISETPGQIDTPQICYVQVGFLKLSVFSQITGI